MFENIELVTSKIILIWMVIIISYMYTFLNKDVFHIGPNNNLIVLHIVIDTPFKYLCIITFSFFNSIVRSLNHNILQSWITNTLQDNEKNNTNSTISKNMSYEIACISCIYNWFDFYMYMHILMSQIDLLFIEISGDIIMTIIITKYYIEKKNEYVLL